MTTQRHALPCCFLLLGSLVASPAAAREARFVSDAPSSAAIGVVTVSSLDGHDPQWLTVSHADGSTSRVYLLEPVLPGDMAVIGRDIVLIDPLPAPAFHATRIARGWHGDANAHAGDARYAYYSNQRYDPDSAAGITTIGNVKWRSADARAFVVESRYGTKTLLTSETTDFDLPADDIEVGDTVRVSYLPTDRLLVAHGQAWVSEPTAAIMVPREPAIVIREPMQRDTSGLSRRIVRTRLPDTATSLPLLGLLGLLGLAAHVALRVTRGS